MPLRSLRGLIYDSREAKLTASTMLAEHLSLRIQSVKTGHYGNSKKNNSECPCGFAVTQAKAISIPCSKWKLRVLVSEELSHLCVGTAGFALFWGDASLPGALAKYTVYPVSLWTRWRKTLCARARSKDGCRVVKGRRKGSKICHENGTVERGKRSIEKAGQHSLCRNAHGAKKVGSVFTGCRGTWKGPLLWRTAWGTKD